MKNVNVYKWLVILMSFIVHTSALFAQNQGCEECIYSTIEAPVTGATIYISWLEQEELYSDSFLWFPEDTISVFCGDGIAIIEDSSFAITPDGDTLNIESWIITEQMVWETIYEVVYDPALINIVDSIYTGNCQGSLIVHHYTPPSNDYTCNSIIHSSSVGYRHEMAFPVGSGNNITIDFVAYNIPDTLIIIAGGVVVFEEAIGNGNGGSFPNNITWDNGNISTIVENFQLNGSGSVRVILDVVDNCDLKVIAQSNINTSTAWQLYVHCCPACYDPPLKIANIDTTLCFEGTIYNTLITSDTSISRLSTTNAGCDSITVFNAHVAKPRIDSILTIDVSCFGFDDGSATAFVTAEAPNYSWDNGTIQNKNTALSTGIYFLTIMDQYGCTTSASVTINEPPLLEGDFIELQPRCYGEKNGELTIIPFGGTPPYDILWFNDKTVVHIDSLLSEEYTVKITDSNKCITEILYFLDQPDTLIADIEEWLPSCLGIPNGKLEVDAKGGTFPYYYSWSTGSEYSILDSLYSDYYAVTATDENGCTDISTKLLRFKFKDKTFVPNAFSPNSDGINDTFRPFCSECAKEIISFLVFDRWGELLFEETYFQPNDQNISWDGHFRGKIMNPGAYTWTLEVLYYSGKKEKQAGIVHIINGSQ